MMFLTLTTGHDIMYDLSNYAQGWIDWNLLVDHTGGPNHLGMLHALSLTWDEIVGVGVTCHNSSSKFSGACISCTNLVCLCVTVNTHDELCTGNLCDAPVVASADFNRIHLQPEYFVIGHFSKFIPPKSVRVDSRVVGNFNFQTSVHPDVHEGIELGKVVISSIHVLSNF